MWGFSILGFVLDIIVIGLVIYTIVWVFRRVSGRSKKSR